MPNSGISNRGRSSEKDFCKFTGADLSGNRSLGDCVLNGHFVEVKRASSNTINQVRPAKYITVVVHDPKTGKWYVVSALEVVKFALEKDRGQHTENPFESMTMSKKKLVAFECLSRELKKKVIKAVNDSGKNPMIKKEMDGVITNTKKLAEETKERVKKLLS